MSEQAGSVGGSKGVAGTGESKAGKDSNQVSDAASKVGSSEVKAQAGKVTAASADSYEKAKPAGPGIGPSEGAVAEAERRKSEDAKVNAAADRLAAASPTAAGLLSKFRDAGGSIVSTEKPGGFISNGHPPTIHVGPGSEVDQMQTVAHELGHFDYRSNPERNFTAPQVGEGVSDRQVAARRERDYIVHNTNVQLADEGNATLVNKQIRNETLRNTGVDIGVAGFNANGPMMRTHGPLSFQRAVIGDYFGSHLNNSVDGDNYRSYYNSGWQQALPKF